MPTFYGVPSDGSGVPEQLATSIAASTGAILAADYGVDVAAAAADNALALQAAVDDAQLLGRNLILPTTAPAEQINIDREILVNGAGGVEIYANGACTIHQTVKPETIFHVYAPNVTLRGFRGVGDGLDMTGMVSGANYLRYCVVWIDQGADGYRVYDVEGKDLHKVVLVDPDYEGGEVSRVGSPVSEVPNVRDGKLLGIVSDRCWAGVLAGAFDGLEISVRGTYLKAFNSGGVDSTGQPPHLIYTLDRTKFDNPRWSYNLHTHDCFAWDSGVDELGEPAAAYAIKGTRGWTYDGMHANNCTGIFDIINIENVSPGTAVSADDIYPNGAGRGSVAIKDSKGAHVRATVRAKAGGDYGRQLYIEGGTDGCLVEGDFTVAPTTARPNAGDAALRISGRNNEARVRVRNTGADMRTAIEIQGSETVGCRVIDPQTAGSFRFPIAVRQGVGNVVDYESTQLPAGESPVNVESLAKATRLNNRTVEVPGYVDTFNRPDSTTLGTTDDGEPYVIRNNGQFGITNGMAVCNWTSSSGAYAFPRGGTADGVITVTIGAVGTSNDGYMFRANYDGTGAPNNWLRLDYMESSTAPRPRVRSVVDGVASTVGAAPEGTVLKAGDVLTITLAGQDITVALNGATIITGVDTNHTSNVASGLSHGAPASGSWKVDQIEFVPAP